MDRFLVGSRVGTRAQRPVGDRKRPPIWFQQCLVRYSKPTSRCQIDISEMGSFQALSSAKVCVDVPQNLDTRPERSSCEVSVKHCRLDIPVVKGKGEKLTKDMLSKCEHVEPRRYLWKRSCTNRNFPEV